MGGKIIASVIAWISYLAMLWITLPTLGTWMILFAFVLMLPLAIFMAMMWGGTSLFMDAKTEDTSEKKQQDSEKRKRERLETVLRDLSDDDLIRLKQRLSDGTLNDAILYKRMLGDDGEIVDYN